MSTLCIRCTFCKGAQQCRIRCNVFSVIPVHVAKNYEPSFCDHTSTRSVIVFEKLSVYCCCYCCCCCCCCCCLLLLLLLLLLPSMKNICLFLAINHSQYYNGCVFLKTGAPHRCQQILWRKSFLYLMPENRCLFLTYFNLRPIKYITYLIMGGVISKRYFYWVPHSVLAVYEPRISSTLLRLFSQLLPNSLV